MSHHKEHDHDHHHDHHKHKHDSDKHHEHDHHSHDHDHHSHDHDHHNHDHAGDHHDHDHPSDDHHAHEHHHDHHDNNEHKQSNTNSSGREMSLSQKFSLLLKNWIDHNNSHKDSYISWAEKAEADKSGENNLLEAAKFLRQTAELSEQITKNLESALNSIRH
ncbi:MAG: hypothetical protein AB7U45_06785 [Desulfamplus sp.]